VDASRHGKRGLSKKESYTAPCINVLFCDGHAESMGVKDAWNSIYYPGRDSTIP
jgi:hypothetical protein